LLSMRNLNRRLSVVIILVWATVCSAEDPSLVPPASKIQASPAVTVNQPVSAPDSSETGSERIPMLLNKQNPSPAFHSEQPTPVSGSDARDNTEQPHYITGGTSAPYSKVSESQAGSAPQPEEQNAQEILTSEEKNDMSSEALIQRLKTYKNIPQIVQDEDYQAVEISLKDVTRVVCFTNVTRAIYSKEKAMEIKTVDRNAFIKNLPREVFDQVTGRTVTEYDSRPKELYLVCGDKTFSLLLIPRDIPANTIYLKSTYVEKERAASFEKSNNYENTILKLISSAYLENVPDGYDVDDIDKVFKEYEEIRLVHKRDYTGIMFQVQEYVVIAKKELNINEITLLEAISPKNPLAVSIVSHVLQPNEQSRVFIVRLMKDE
jgi:conjugal transfer pilus assembly protein TraK